MIFAHAEKVSGFSLSSNELLAVLLVSLVAFASLLGSALYLSTHYAPNTNRSTKTNKGDAQK